MKHFTLIAFASLVIMTACKQDEDPAVQNQYSITIIIADAPFADMEFEYVLLKNDQVIGTGSGDTLTFSGLEEGQDYTIIPQPLAPSSNGMSTLDLVKLEDFINQQTQLSPFELLAADVNLDNVVDTLDANIIRTCIISDENCPGWRFATIDYNGTGTGSADKVEFPNLFGNQQVTFKVFKLGDINCTIIPC